MNRQLEILAPAGDLATLKTAVMAGADAVYFGGSEFGARAYAANFSLEDAEKGIEYAHSRGARTYLTVNTLLKSIEIERKVYDYLKDYYNAGIDAVLVQDIGLMQMIRDCFPELHLHISTQANVTSEYGASFFKKLGATRVVLARELSLKEIERIHKSCDIELECFAHGALCVSYSGQCLMSSMIGGRSGNRGRCAQPCRKCYDLYDADIKRRTLPGRYPISMKDLCTISDVKALYDAGCSSLKIEGRMKSKEYVSSVVSSYKKVRDIIIEGTDPDSDEIKALKAVSLEAGTRGGSTDKYLYARNGTDMITFSDSSFSSDGPSSVFIAGKKVKARAYFTAETGQPLSLTISDGTKQVTVDGPVVEAAKKPKDIAAEIKDKIIKTGDDRIDITDVSVDASPQAFVPVSLVKSLRREAVYRFFGGIRINRNEPLPFTPEKIRSKRADTKKLVLVTCLSVKQLEAASKVLADDDIIAINYDLYSQMSRSEIGKIRQKKYLCLPDILRSDMMPDIEADLFDGFVISSFDEIEYVKDKYPGAKCIFDYRLYHWSDRSTGALMSMGAEYLSASVELNEKELSHLDNSSSLICVYGRTAVMYMANCTHKNSIGCDKKREVLYLRDERKADFPVVNLCSSCTNIVYNSLPTSLLPYIDKINSMGFAGVRADFTIESPDEVKNVLNILKGNIYNGSSDDITSDVTRGHFHRGVS